MTVPALLMKSLSGMAMSDKQYSVWVGGIEANDRYLTTYDKARKLAEEYISEGYDDVQIEEL